MCLAAASAALLLLLSAPTVAPFATNVTPRSCQAVALAVLVAAAAGALGVGAAFLTGADARALLLVGLALSFSSTVFVVKLLEERSATRSLAGRTAIGVLVVQDLAAEPACEESV